MRPADLVAFAIDNVSELDSPSLLIYEERVDENLRRMVAQASSPERLCPHVKTHKLPQLIEKQLALGIRKFKAATIAEAEMCAAAGAPSVLLAHAPVGPRASRLVDLMRAFPQTAFATLVDDEAVAQHLSAVTSAAGLTIDTLLDIDCGMHRSGIAPGRGAEQLYALLNTLPGLRAAGLHAYDGHIHDTDVLERQAKCDHALAPVLTLRERLRGAGFEVSRLVCGGSPTFPFLAARGDLECSPRHLRSLGLRLRHHAPGSGLPRRRRPPHARHQPPAPPAPVPGSRPQVRGLGDAPTPCAPARSRRRHPGRPQRRAPHARHTARRPLPLRHPRLRPALAHLPNHQPPLRSARRARLPRRDALAHPRPLPPPQRVAPHGRQAVSAQDLDERSAARNSPPPRTPSSAG